VARSRQFVEAPRKDLGRHFPDFFGSRVGASIHPFASSIWRIFYWRIFAVGLFLPDSRSRHDAWQQDDNLFRRI
jgi:hypothetical protein